MSKSIYVGNLSYSISEQELSDAFGAYGTVESVNIITDKFTGRPRGFAFVEMSEGADAAIEALNETDLKGRQVTVNEARPRANNNNNNSSNRGERGNFSRRERY